MAGQLIPAPSHSEDPFDVRVATRLSGPDHSVTRRVQVPAGDAATLSAVLDGCPTGVLVLDRGGRVLQANRAACELLGLDAKRLLAAYRQDYLGLARPLGRPLRGGEGAPLRQVVLRPDGSARAVEFRIQRLPENQPNELATVYLLDAGPVAAPEVVPSAPETPPQDEAASADARSQATGVPSTAVDQVGSARAPGDHLRGQAEILRRIATGGPLDVTLSRLTELVVSQLVENTAPTTDPPPLGPACALVSLRGPGSAANLAGSAGFPALEAGRLLDAVDSLVAPARPEVWPIDVLAARSAHPEVAVELITNGHRALVVLPVNPLPPAGTDFDLNRPGGERVSGPANQSVRPLGLLVCLLAEARPLLEREIELLQSTADLAAIALERDRSERDLASHALRDPLTGLANRNLLVDRLSQALNRAKRRNRNLALMFLDLDRFKNINDSLGHHAGDIVLRQFAERLRVLVRPEDTVARFGGDEFVVLVEHVLDQQDAAQIADRVERAMAEPFSFDGRQLAVTVSVGIVIGSGEDDATALLRKADAAMYRAKELGRNRTEVYDLALEAHLANRSQMALDLRHAMVEGQLHLRYRPLLAPGQDHTATGPRALWLELGWDHPLHDRLLTREILTLADDSGQGMELAIWRVERGLAGLKALRPDAGWDPTWPLPRLGVPLTGRQLGHPELAERVTRVLRSAGPFPSTSGGSGEGGEEMVLWGAVPEAALSTGGQVAIQAVAALRRASVGLALEEIGATPSSALLSLLGRVTVDLLVLDPSVVAALGDPRAEPDAAMTGAGEAARSMCAGLAGLGHSVGMTVAAAGVDEPAHRQLLAELGYDLACGEALAAVADLDTLVRGLAAPPPTSAAD